MTDFTELSNDLTGVLKITDFTTLSAELTGSPKVQQVLNRKFYVVFTGSGSEYFRIWIINLLLTLATAGLYLPWAKARRLRYFMGNKGPNPPR